MKSLSDTLHKLKETSPAAAKIIDKHFSGFVAIAAAEAQADKQESPDELKELVHTLLDTVTYQAKVIDQLSDKLPTASPSIAEDAEAFEASLKGAYVSDLIQFYNKSALLPYKEDTRLTVCKVLVNFAKEKNKNPSPIWVSVVANNGALEI